MNYGLDNILRKFLDMEKAALQPQNYIVKTTVDHLMNNNQVFEEMISDPKLTEFFECFIKHPHRAFREMAASAILSNVDTTILIFKSFEEDHTNEIILGYLNIIFYFLADEESSVGLKMSKFLEKVIFFF